MDKQVKNNNFKYIASSLTYGLASVMSIGAVLQTFMAFVGLEDKISVFTAVSTVVQAVSMLVCSFYCNRVKNVIRTNGVILALFPIFFAFLIALDLGFLAGKSNDAFVFLLVGSFIFNVLLGIYNTVVYVLPYSVIKLGDYGKFSSISGFLVGIGGFLITLIIPVCIQTIDYKTVILVAFILGALLYFYSSYCVFTMKPLYVGTVEKTAEVNVFKYPLFYKLIPANLLRGLSQGMIGLITVFGLKTTILTAESSTLVATVTTFVGIASNLVYLALTRKFKPKPLTIACGVGVLVGSPLIIAFGGIVPFLSIYSVVFCLMTVIGVLIPVMVYDYVPKEYIGKYTAWRMLIFTFGVSLPGFFLDWLLEAVNPVIVLLASGACMFYCCVSYVCVFKKKISTEDAPAVENGKE